MPLFKINNSSRRDSLQEIYFLTHKTGYLPEPVTKIQAGNGVTQNETTLDAGRQLTLSSGRDTTLSGAQASGSKVVADVGRNLTLSSMQDSNSYDSKQTSVSAGGSFTFGSMSGSAYLSANRDKMKSNYDSVIEQTGIFGGQDGFDITVGNHAQLNGAVIGSTATADKNRLDTGTLGFSDIDNRADYKVQHVGGSFSTGAPAGSQLLSNMTSTLLSGLGSSGHAEGITHAAVSEGTVVIRDQSGQQQDVSQLSRDVTGANGSISPIFDREKEQKRLQTAQLVGEIAGKAMEMAQTEGTLRATEAGKAELARKGVQEPGEKATKEEWKAYNDALTGTDGYKSTEAKFGTGSAIQRGIQAATAALQGLVSGNVQGAIAGASAPYLAELIHRETITTGPDGKEVVNEPANLIAHAVLGAVVAQIQNNSALAGATGATAGEFIAQQLYPGMDRDKLSEGQKQIVSELGTLAAGLAGGIAGDSTASAVAGAQAGKNAVENNSLSGDKARETVKQTATDMKDQVRETLGNGTLSSIVNSIIGAAADSGDAILGTADYGADAAMALTACAVGDGYCGTALDDLSGKNQVVADSLKALMKSETWSSVADTVKQAWDGNQVALEATGGVLASIILPGKKVPHVPNAGAVGNISEFFKQSGFGTELKDLSKKTSKQYQGQSVYKADKPVGDYIKRGDQFYLDAKHKDHIEVFDSTGTKVKAVLNLDGSYNQKKTEAAIKEGRRLPK